MRTKQPKQYKPDFAEVSRRSIRKDFQNASIRIQGREPRPNPEEQRPKRESNVKRIISMDGVCDYKQYRRFFIGKLVRIIASAQSGGKWVSFVHEQDKNALNSAAGWSENKCQYLLYGVKYD